LAASLFFLIRLCPTPTPPLFPYTTLFRSLPPSLRGEEQPAAPGRTQRGGAAPARGPSVAGQRARARERHRAGRRAGPRLPRRSEDRKSTRLNSSHVSISYAVFCLKKKMKS